MPSEPLPMHSSVSLLPLRLPSQPGCQGRSAVLQSCSRALIPAAQPHHLLEAQRADHSLAPLRLGLHKILIRLTKP